MRLQITALGVTSIFLLAACGSNVQAKSEDEVVVFGNQAGAATALPYMVAQKQGFFSDEGIKVESVDVQGGGPLITSAASGSIDFFMQAAPLIVPANQQGMDLRFFCGNINTDLTTIVAPADSNLPTVEEAGNWQDVIRALKGKEFGIAALGAHHENLALALMKEAGLKQGDITLVPVGAGAPAVAAFDSGQVDAMFGIPFTTQQVVASGSGKLLMRLNEDGPEVFRDSLYTGYIASAKWLDKNPDTAERLCDAIGQGMEYMQDPDNAKEMSALLQSDFGITEAAVADAILEPEGDISLYETKLECPAVEAAAAFIVGTDADATKQTCDTLLWQRP